MFNTFHSLSKGYTQDKAGWYCDNTGNFCYKCGQSYDKTGDKVDPKTKFLCPKVGGIFKD